MALSAQHRRGQRDLTRSSKWHITANYKTDHQRPLTLPLTFAFLSVLARFLVSVPLVSFYVCDTLKHTGWNSNTPGEAAPLVPLTQCSAIF